MKIVIGLIKRARRPIIIIPSTIISSFVYTGAPHQLELSGTLPAGASLTYSDNIRTDVGTQTAIARVSGSNYQPLELRAALTVTPAAIPDLDGFDLVFADGSFVYTGALHQLELSGTLPAGASVTYTNHSRTDVGTQTATARINGIPLPPSAQEVASPSSPYPIRAHIVRIG